jgi:hypothetical protein
MNLPTATFREKPTCRSQLRPILLATMALGVAACGSSDDESAPAATSATVDSGAGTSSGAAGPVSGTSSSDSDSCFGFTMFGPIVGADCQTGDFFSYPSEDAILAMSTFDYALDIEPNDDLQTAAVLPVHLALYDVIKNSVATFGTLSSGPDVIDNYTFTSPEATRLGIELCSSNLAPCGQQTTDSNLAIGIAHIEVFDQLGQLLASTAINLGTGNFVSVDVDSGVSYYVSVVGGSLPETQDYYLRLTRMPATDSTSATEPVAPSAPDLSYYNESAFGVDTGLSRTFYWTAPSTNNDGTALLDLDGYVFYYGLVPEGTDSLQDWEYGYSERLAVGLSAYTVSVPDYGTWRFALTSVNAVGVESGHSMSILLTIAPPEAP